MHDSDEKLKAKHRMFPINLEKAKELNPLGYGIFISVNHFKSVRRTIENLDHLVALAVDIDDAPKQEQLARVRKGLLPSLIVESKRSLQVYWRLKRTDLPAIEFLRCGLCEVMDDRLIPFYGADKNAKDIARVLRMPGFYHMKNPHDPFLVEKIWEFDVAYSWQDVMSFYPDFNKEKKQKKEKAELIRKTKSILTNGNSFWEKVYSLNCEDALIRLSGKPIVNNEIFSFRNNKDQTKQIYVNGKTTSSWIDSNGKIGSLSNGGPTIAQWLKWYNNSWKTVVEIIESEFPECKAK